MNDFSPNRRSNPEGFSLPGATETTDDAALIDYLTRMESDQRALEASNEYP